MSHSSPIEKPTIFLTGQSGMLGQHLTQSLSADYHVHGLTRNGSANNPSWNYREALAELDIETPDILIHLAGAGIADKRWTDSYKQTLYESRSYGTQWLVDEIMLYDQQPKTFISASAIGYYGNRPGELLDEDSPPGDNFVAQIAKQWELKTQRLKHTETRLINLRFGMILSKTGGALKDMLTPFKLGLGGRLGDGKQIYSWISIADATAAIDFLINQDQCEGIYNLTAPQAVSNQEFTQTLAKTLNRPSFMHMPAFVVRLIFGEVADELLLADAHVVPKKLQEAGYEFRHPSLADAMQEIFK